MGNVITSEDLLFLTKLANEMITQDRRATADPYYYTVRSEKYIASYPEQDGDRTVWVDDDDAETYYSQEEIEEHCKDYEYTDKEAKEWKDSLREIHETLSYEYKGFFLTQVECEQHIKLNSYHYCNPVSYVAYEWRNYSIEKLFKIIKKFATVEPVEG